MNTTRRSEFEIKIEMLKTISKDKIAGVKPTHILYGTRISWTMLQKLLNELIDKGMINLVNPVDGPYGRIPDRKTRHLYKITEKGVSFLETIEEYL